MCDYLGFAGAPALFYAVQVEAQVDAAEAEDWEAEGLRVSVKEQVSVGQ